MPSINREPAIVIIKRIIAGYFRLVRPLQLGTAAEQTVTWAAKTLVKAICWPK